jgi:hypothetical protein
MRKTLLALAAIAIIAVVAILALGLVFFSPGSVKINGIIPVYNGTDLTANILSASQFTCNPGAVFKVTLNVMHNLSTSNLIINNIYTTSPGFAIASINSSLPIIVNSSIPLLINVRAPSYASQGALFLYMNTSSFIIVDVISNWKRSMTSFEILNDGSTPITLEKMYLFRSDGILVNSTDLSLPEVLPSQEVNFNCSLSYDQATATELYYIKLVSSNGAISISPSIPIACNCTSAG